jgi:hypothetical protein
VEQTFAIHSASWRKRALGGFMSDDPVQFMRGFNKRNQVGTLTLDQGFFQSAKSLHIPGLVAALHRDKATFN